jgi:Zn-dependent peptidase ImmA (M78 family)
MIDPAATPDQILTTLGITEPSDIDIEAIAYACGALIIREPLSGCEANIIGVKDKAVITVNSKSIETRQRFSAGHELGHWMRDRGESAFGCSTSQMDSEWSANNPETRANRFASDLLLPLSMFARLAHAKPITNESVADLATTFRMSKTATAIRLVEHGLFPAIIAYFESGLKKWSFPKKREVPYYLKPTSQPGSQTVTAGMFADPSISEDSDDIRADHWFDADRSERYYIRESCFRTGPNSVVTLLWWEDEKQLIDLAEAEERRDSRRFDWRKE